MADNVAKIASFPPTAEFLYNQGTAVATLGSHTAWKKVAAKLTRVNSATPTYTFSSPTLTAMTDVGGANLVFPNCATANNGQFTVATVTATCNRYIASPPTLSLMLFARSVTAQTDGAGIALTGADLINSDIPTLVAKVDITGTYTVLNASTTVGTGFMFRSISVSTRTQCQGGQSSLFGVVALGAAYTPAASEVWTFILELTY